MVGREGGREGRGHLGGGGGQGFFRVELRCSFCVCMFCLSKGEAGCEGGGGDLGFWVGCFYFPFRVQSKCNFFACFICQKGGWGEAFQFLGGGGGGR